MGETQEKTYTFKGMKEIMEEQGVVFGTAIKLLPQEERIQRQAQAAARVIVAFRMALAAGAFDESTENEITKEFAKVLFMHNFCGHQFEANGARLIDGDLK